MILLRGCNRWWFSRQLQWRGLGVQYCRGLRHLSSGVHDERQEGSEREATGERKRVAVIGGGISGLTAAYFLQKGGCDVELFEASERCGGWLRSEEVTVGGTSVMLERGPRSLRVKGGRETLALAHEIGIAPHLIGGAEKASKGRMLLVDGELQPLPGSLLGALQSPLLRPVLANALREPWARARGMGARVSDCAAAGDESVYDFFIRRFGRRAADAFASAMTLGIFAANAKQVSVEACFPVLVELEREYGSVVGGLVKRKVRRMLGQEATPKGDVDVIQDERVRETVRSAGIFSFEGGVEELVLGLRRCLEAMGGCVHCGHEVAALESVSGGMKVSVQAGDGTRSSHHFHHVFSSIGSHALAGLARAQQGALQQVLSSIAYSDVAVVSLFFRSAALSQPLPEVFGYLAPVSELHPLLGVTFDSACFLEHHRSGEELVRVTAMMGGDASIADEQRALWRERTSMQPPPAEGTVVDLRDVECASTEFLTGVALREVGRVLGVTGPPVFAAAGVLKNAIPKYELGHRERVRDVRAAAAEAWPASTLIGNAYETGVGINDCIKSAKRASEAFLRGECWP